TLQDEGVQPLDLDFDADLVGITAITGTSLRAYRIADALRARGQTVVLGGVHATLLPDEAAPHADTLVLGYGESSWPELLRDFKRGRLKPRYQAPTGRTLAVPIARRDLLKRTRYDQQHRGYARLPSQVRFLCRAGGLEQYLCASAGRRRDCRTGDVYREEGDLH
ncbi:MAG: hypothetical protein E6K70_18325, partial [Planctomycetota bacterium]